jgi:tetratricopeptide (TPR) repeat protein
MTNMLKFLVLTLVLAIFTPIFVLSQKSDDYTAGVQLIRQSQFEEAYKIFSRLYTQNPNNFPIYDQLINTLINLKQYDEAILITSKKLNQNYADIVLATKLAELYHLNGNIKLAYQTWDLALEANINSIQAFRYIGENMIYRREHEKAIEIYLLARRTFNNLTLFFSEITNGYVAMGRRDDAVKTIIEALGSSLGNGAFILRQIIGFDDPKITELAILEINDRLNTRLIAGPEHAPLNEVLIGLLMEGNYYRRALSTAKRYESQAENGVWPVYTLANRLKSQQEFELANEALTYYIIQSEHPLLARSLEDRARLFITWRKYLKDHNLDFGSNIQDLNTKALQDLDTLITKHKNYQRFIEVLSLKTELILDTKVELDLANTLVQVIKSNSFNQDHEIITEYLEGRIQMIQGSHGMARINFTRANRLARTGEMAEKTRYYLALNDFYAGDFEFSSIQMRALERLNTSFYANDALKLRVWMREGVQQDIPTEELRQFSKAKYLFDTHKKSEALSLLFSLITGPDGTPLKGESVLMISDYLKSGNTELIFDLLTITLKSYQGPLAERLNWEKVRLADGIYSNEISLNLADNEFTREFANWISSQTTADNLELYENSTMALSMDLNKLTTMYEDMLNNFPNGFYATSVRSRLAKLNFESL